MPAKPQRPRLTLVKNLKRDLKRGHPWVYLNALDKSTLPKSSGFVDLYDKKDGFLATGIFDRGSDLAFRVLSLEKSTNPLELIVSRLKDSLKCRRSLVGKSGNSFRWLHGEGDRLPGLVIDVFASTAVVQTDGKNLLDVYPLEDIAKSMTQLYPFLEVVVFKPQAGKGEAKVVVGQLEEPRVEFLEKGIRWTADVLSGQKTGFFLDQRENREFVRGFSKGLDVLNVFSYTGGFSLAAGVGGAKTVTSVDISKPAILECDRHWSLNGLDPKQHRGHAVNAFDFLQKEKSQYDLIVVDPPAFASSKASLSNAISSYESVFSSAVKRVSPGGYIALSSCSRAVRFDDFEGIVQRSLSLGRRTGRVLHVSGQPFDHPYPHICPELRYLKFYFLKLDQ